MSERDGTEPFVYLFTHHYVMSHNSKRKAARTECRYNSVQFTLSKSKDMVDGCGETKKVQKIGYGEEKL